ncbi:phosphate regulon transcriptional regulatory protein PhoB [compost metagenome]
MACSGRVQPKACYIIDVKFQAETISPLQKGYLIGGLPLLAFVGLLISRSVKREKKTAELNGTSGVFRIGYTVFDFMQQHLLFEGTKTILTNKENKLLFIFANAPNQVVERSRLQKEIWEDEGVIVGRSLDVFISKLRKKLEKDAAIQLINIHGRGYRMEINQNS